MDNPIFIFFKKTVTSKKLSSIYTHKESQI